MPDSLVTKKQKTAQDRIKLKMLNFKFIKILRDLE